MNKTKLSQFIGRQLSRLKAGQTYYMIAVSTMTALGILNIAFPSIDFWIFIILFPIVLFGAYLMGYFLDKSNVLTMDQQKTIEMTHRYLNTADLKEYEFWFVIITAIFKWIESIQKEKPINFEELKNEYDKFFKKWSPPEDKNSKINKFKRKGRVK